MTDDVLWARAGSGIGPLPPLDRDLDVDVAVVGGGIVGLAAAHRLAGSHSVALLEARRIGTHATGRSTAKATSQHGPIYRRLVSDIGEDGARAYGRANEAAIGWILERAADGAAEGPEGEETAQRAEALIYAESEKEARALQEEAEVAARLGLPARFAPTPGGLPFPCTGTLVFERQAAINPYLLLRGLAGQLRGRVAIHEATRVTRVEHGEPCRLEANGHAVRATWVIIATQIPTVPEGKFFAKAFPHAHPVVAARRAGGSVPDGMWISLSAPTRSFRAARVAGEDWVVATGEGFRPGEGDDQARAFDGIEGFLRSTLGLRPELRWVNEDFMPMDGLPFVGRATRGTPKLLVATGFNAWGITGGVAAAEILAAAVRGEEHPLGSHLDATRLRPAKGGATFVKENAKSGVEMVRDRLLRRQVERLEAIAPGEAGIVSHGGRQVAVSRDASGRATAVSAICTHLGCVVGWNPVDRSWDCPCHGSRFTAEGEVLTGPAVTALEPVALDAGEEAPAAKGRG